MIIGHTFFGGQFFDGNVSIGNVNRIDLKNVIADEIKIDTGTNQNYSTGKQDWGTNTILQCLFKDLLFESGNVKLNGMSIEYLRIKKRKIDDLTWNTYKDLPFNIEQTEYNWSDLFVESLQDYEYAVLPLGSQGIEGDYGIKSVTCDYDDIWILGENDEQFHLIANISMGDITTVSPSAFIETLGSQYPYEISNGSVNYKKGTVKATLLSDSTLSEANGINRIEEKKLRNSLYKFLTNKKPKIFKESEGNYLLVSIKADSVRITPNNDISRRIADINFDFYQIDDAESIEVLQKYRLLK